MTRRVRLGRARAGPGRGFPRGRGDATRAARGARKGLRPFRQSSFLAVVLTALLFLLLGLGEADVPGADDEPLALADPPPVAEQVDEGPLPGQEPVVDPGQEPLEAEEVVRAALDEARETALGLWYAFLRNLPQYLVALAVLLLAWALTRLARPLFRRFLGQWERANAFTALGGVMIWLLAIGVAMSVLVGDVRALVGSLGLVGLALSWALQNPIEAFTGWLMNGIRGYYRVGDRIAVGEIMGDVFQIDVFTTTVWETGGLDRPGVFVTAEQPTGRLITFPNNEVLTGSIVNLTRDFPYVWDEMTIAVGNESDLRYARSILQEAAERIVGEQMAEPAVRYGEILRKMRLEQSVAREPEVFISLADAWTNLTVRYLVHARERRIWRSRLSEAAMEAFNAPEHTDRIRGAFPRWQIGFVGPDGKPREIPGAKPREDSSS